MVHGPAGFACVSMEAAELARLRECIREQWLYRLQLAVPREVRRFAAIPMDQYHTLAHLVDHASLWPKVSRVLPARGAEIVRSLSFFRRLESEYGDVRIADEEGFGWPNIVWRLVRPRQKDIGPIHADEWFWEVRPQQERLPGFIPVKVWSAIHCNGGKNGLRLVPGSHRQRGKYRYRREDRNGMVVPAYDGDEDALPFEVPKTDPGDAIVFNHFLLHGGVWNAEEATRVSAEFTIFVPERFGVDRAGPS
jgi:hypothetical protein